MMPERLGQNVLTKQRWRYTSRVPAGGCWSSVAARCLRGSIPARCCVPGGLFFNSATRSDERIIVSVPKPWPSRNVTRFDELPVRQVLPLQAKVITDRRRDIQSGTAVGIQLRLFIPENVLKIVRS